jgi:RNA polymerase sigma-70 factor, ECF subfamily
MAEKAHPVSGITEQLRHWNKRQDPEANNALMNLVYDELHRQAHRYLQKERNGHTLQTTALVHEAYLKLIEQKSAAWESRSQFFGLAATMMRRILIDYAKSKHRIRRGGSKDDLSLENAMTVTVSDTNFDLLELDEALTRLG